MRRCMHRVLGFMKPALESVYLPLFIDSELHTSQHASWNPEIDARIAACFNVCGALKSDLTLFVAIITYTLENYNIRSADSVSARNDRVPLTKSRQPAKCRTLYIIVYVATSHLTQPRYFTFQAETNTSIERVETPSIKRTDTTQFCSTGTRTRSEEQVS